MIQRDIMQKGHDFGILFLFTFQALLRVTSKEIINIIIF